MDAEIERWRRYLRRDPTRFLLDDKEPSVQLWYLIEVAGRPEGSPAVRELRERVLYSQPVQDLFAAQRPEGFWEPADQLAEPRYRATLWNLALLAELALPRDSRRARAACEFILQNFQEENGLFKGLGPVESGYLAHALAYFLPADARVRGALDALLRHAAAPDENRQTRLLALWAGQQIAGVPDQPRYRELAEQAVDDVANRTRFGAITFPPFEPDDPLLILRVLTRTPLSLDPRLEPLVEAVIARQNELGQWPLEQSLNGRLLTRVEDASNASRWATWNAVRVIVRLVRAEPARGT